MRIIDTWFGMEGEEDDKPFLIRGREKINSFRKKGEHQIRVDIVFEYLPKESNGLPDTSQMDLMERIENALVAELEEDIHGILALVYTGNSHRVWYWYCKDVAVTKERINSALALFPEKLPLKIYSTKDPEWTAYNEILD